MRIAIILTDFFVHDIQKIVKWMELPDGLGSTLGSMGSIVMAEHGGCSAWLISRTVEVLGGIRICSTEGAVDQLLHGRRGLEIALPHSVRVDPQRGVWAGVPEPTGYGYSIHIVGEEDRGMGMPEIVEADALEAVAVREFPPLLRRGVFVEGLAIPGTDDQAIFMPPIS